MASDISKLRRYAERVSTQHQDCERDAKRAESLQREINNILKHTQTLDLEYEKLLEKQQQLPVSIVDSNSTEDVKLRDLEFHTSRFSTTADHLLSTISSYNAALKTLRGVPLRPNIQFSPPRVGGHRLSHIAHTDTSILSLQLSSLLSATAVTSTATLVQPAEFNAGFFELATLLARTIALTKYSGSVRIIASNPARLVTKNATLVLGFVTPPAKSGTITKTLPVLMTLIHSITSHIQAHIKSIPPHPLTSDAIAGRSFEGDGVDWQMILNAALRVVGWMYECGEKIAARGTSKVT